MLLLSLPQILCIVFAYLEFSQIPKLFCGRLVQENHHGVVISRNPDQNMKKQIQQQEKVTCDSSVKGPFYLDVLLWSRFCLGVDCFYLLDFVNCVRSFYHVSDSFPFSCPLDSSFCQSDYKSLAQVTDLLLGSFMGDLYHLDLAFLGFAVLCLYLVHLGSYISY